MNTHEINRLLIQARTTIERTNGKGMQQHVNLYPPPTSNLQAKVDLEGILAEPEASDAQRAEASELRERLREKCGF
jgi:hypothetical protein